MWLLGGLNWNVAHFCVVKETIQLEYGHVTHQISPNLNLIEYVMAGPTEIDRHGLYSQGVVTLIFQTGARQGQRKNIWDPSYFSFGGRMKSGPAESNFGAKVPDIPSSPGTAPV